MFGHPKNRDGIVKHNSEHSIPIFSQSLQKTVHTRVCSVRLYVTHTCKDFGPQNLYLRVLNTHAYVCVWCCVVLCECWSEFVCILCYTL